MAKSESADKTVTHSRIAFSSSWVSLSFSSHLFPSLLSPPPKLAVVYHACVCVTQGERADMEKDGIKIEFSGSTNGIESTPIQYRRV